MRKTGLILMMIMISGLSSLAQYRLSGTVSDQESGEKLPAAAVQLKDSPFAMLTLNKGEFAFTKVQKGEYLLVISYVGYDTYQQKITLNGDLNLDIKLPAGILLKETAIIQATRVPVNAPATLTNIKKQELQARNNGFDLPYLLAGIPSAVITSDAGTGIGYTGIRIRGTDMTRINVTVNGIPFNDPESHEVYWVDMPDIASSIDNIEIQRGVGTSTNGAASFGGSINILTEKTNPKPYAEINTSMGSFNSFKSSLNAGSGLMKGKYAVDARVSKIKSDGYIDRASADLESFFVSGTFLTSKTMLKMNVFSGKELTYQAWDGVPGNILDTNRTFNVNGMYYDSSGIIHFYNNEVDNYRQDNYQLLFSQALPGKVNLNAALHYTRGKGYYEQYKQDADPSSFGLTSSGNPQPTDLVCQKWLKNDFFGMTWSLLKTNTHYSFTLGGAWNQYLGDHFGKVIWTSHSFEQQVPGHQWYFNEGDKQETNIYSKVMVTSSPRLGFLADLQFRQINYSIDGKDDDLRDLTQEHHYSFFNPKAGLIYKLSKKEKIHLYFGMANREPNRTNFKDADKGATPEPERLYNYELGYTLSGEKLKAALNMYFMDYDNQLVLTGKINNVGAPIMVNVPESFRLGIELSSDIKIVQFLAWSGNLTLSRNKIKKFTEYIDNWETGEQIANNHKNADLSFSPSVIANSKLLFSPFNKLNISLLTKYTGKQYIDNTSSEDRKLNSYFVNDIRIDYTSNIFIFKNINISLTINNVFNEKYETNAWVYRYYYDGKFNTMDGYFPQATRNIMAGIKIRL